jgi:branched-chain amino acid transport system ATP-binding protein
LASHLLEINGVDIFYGDVPAVCDVSLHVDEGAIVALVGANGAGKTSILRSVSGIIRPQKGDILFSGESLTRLKPQEIVDLGISQVPEGRRLFSDLTVLENLKLGAYLPRTRALFDQSLQRIYDLFSVLEARKDQKAGSLSGGEQQMLAIARAMMSQPKVLMLDEPSLGLSPIFVRAMFELIDALNDQGMTVLLVEQNVRQALKIAHHAYVLKTGKIVMKGYGEDLLADPEVQRAYIGER